MVSLLSEATQDWTAPLVPLMNMHSRGSTGGVFMGSTFPKKTTFVPWSAKVAAVALLGVGLAACSSGALSPGLVARMDQPGANLNRAEALGLINQYRATRGVPALDPDSALDAKAAALAGEYARTSSRPSVSDKTLARVRFSAGYATFSETFSGWRGSGDDANAIADPTATRAGLAVAYSPGSSYGVHWVLLLGKPLAPPKPDFAPRSASN